MIAASHPFVKTVATALRRHCAVPAGARLVVATSGGADSVALLRALAVLAGRRSWRLDLVVGHVQHGVRAEAESEAVFVSDLAICLGLPFERRDLDPRAAGDTTNQEARLRRARYAALAEMADAVDAEFVATAHHGDDQLETLLMRMLRGASVRGLGGMRWRRRIAPGAVIRLVRPMLSVDRAEGVAFLEQLGQPWREDVTNADVSRLRARLRRDVVPVLQALQPRVTARAAELCDHMRGLSRVLDDTTDALAQEMVGVSEGRIIIDRDRSRRIGRVLLSEVIRVAVLKAGARPDRVGRRNLDRVVRAVLDRRGGCRQFALNAGVMLTVTRDTIEIEPGGAH